MKTSSRILIISGVVLGVLLIATIVLVFTLGQGNSAPLAENTAPGIVQRYLQAVQDKDFARAYSYLAPLSSTDINKGFPQTYAEYVTSAQNANNTTWKASLGKTSETATTASVEVTVETFSQNGPFGNPVNSHNVIFALEKAGADWKITAPRDLYWMY